ncbi:unnamed protein product [Rotaria sordida]|uniref:Uncharacterized protein n=1 Tax=Rotaria sordida TaxID=392033 RepID=A0A819DMK8_9BILA|nr:unnamed protein product [Rotaria sordida]
MFAYHHGKNCTDSDSIDNNVNPTVDKSITLSTLQPTNLSQFSTKSIVDHEKHITTTSVDFETVSNRENMPFQRSYSAKNTIEDLDNDDHRRREQEEVSHYDGIKLVYFTSTTPKSKCD